MYICTNYIFYVTGYTAIIKIRILNILFELKYFKN